MIKGWVNGLQRSGTNYTEALLKMNLGIGYEEHHITSNCWKHQVTRSESREYEGIKGFKKEFHSYDYKLVVTVHKNPYTWAESIAHRYDGQYISTQQLHGNAQYPHPKENVKLYGPNAVSLPHLAKTWSSWVGVWYDQGGKTLQNHLGVPVIRIRYEDLLDEAGRRDFLNNVAQQTGALFNPNVIKSGRIIVPQPGSLENSRGFKANNINYYRNVQLKMPPEAIREFNEHLPDKVLELTGYQRINA